MRVIAGYIRFIDACLADATSKNDVFRVDLLGMPMAIAATLTVLPALVLRFAGARDVWETAFGIAFLGLMAVHFIALFWRWSIFDFEDYTGKKRDPRYEDFR